MNKWLRKRFFTELWHVGLLQDDNSIKWLPSPGSYQFFADPFLVEDKGRYFLFVERYSYLTKYGVIEVLELDASGNIIERQAVLDTGSHLSFPCVFEHQGGWYLLPESHKTNELALYRFSEFPWRCEKDKVLIQDIKALDSSFFNDGQYLWLLTTPERLQDNDPWELHLYFSQSLAGPWQAHPKNPVVKNDKTARNAGRLFERAGKLLRPAQDCRGSYGQQVIINQIKVLSPTDYGEEVIEELPPQHAWPYQAGCHTYSQAGKLQVIDAKEVKFTPFKFIMLYKRRFKRWFG